MLCVSSSQFFSSGLFRSERGVVNSTSASRSLATSFFCICGNQVHLAASKSLHLCQPSTPLQTLEVEVEETHLHCSSVDHHALTLNNFCVNCQRTPKGRCSATFYNMFPQSSTPALIQLLHPALPCSATLCLVARIFSANRHNQITHRRQHRQAAGHWPKNAQLHSGSSEETRCGSTIMAAR
jgi:hypothetical protein